MKQYRAVLSIILICCMLSSCSISSLIRMPTSPKDFTKEGMTLTLDSSFQEAELDGFTVCYENSEIAVLTLKEAFAAFDGLEEMSLDEYTAFIIDTNSDKNPQPLDSDGLQGITYDFYNEEEKIEYSYLVCTYRSSDAFWLIQFACRKEAYEQHEADMRAYAKSVRFEDAGA